MNGSYDYIFVGAGIAAGAAAYHLLQAEPRARILLLDRLPFYAQESTGKSASAVRDVFGNRINRQLAHCSIRAYREIDQQLRGSEDFPDGLQLTLPGYLWLFNQERWEANRGILEEVRAEGKVEFLSVEEARRRFLPGLESRVPEELRGKRMGDLLAEAGGEDGDDGELAALADEHAYLDDITHAVYGAGCGYLDPTALANFYYARVRERAGVELRFRTSVEEILERGGRVVGARARGPEGTREFTAARVILSAGAYAHGFLARRGLGHLVRPQNHMLFTFGSEGVRGLLHSGGRRAPFPLVIFYHRAYFRPYAEDVLVGRADRIPPPPCGPEDEPAPYQQWADDRYFTHVIRPLLSEHLPQFRHGLLKGHGCGLYEDSPDRTPIVGGVPGTDGLYLIGAFSGSGIMKAHAAGLLLARLLVAGEARFSDDREEVDGSLLSFDRFARPGGLLQETFVI